MTNAAQGARCFPKWGLGDTIMATVEREIHASIEACQADVAALARRIGVEAPADRRSALLKRLSCMSGVGYLSLELTPGRFCSAYRWE